MREVEIYAGMVESSLDISGRLSYAVVLADGTTLELPRDPDNRQGAVVAFVDALRKHL